jgi:arginase
LRKISFLGIPYSAGQPFAGVARASSFFREEGHLQTLIERSLLTDLGEVDLDQTLEKNLLQNSVANEKVSGLIENLELKDSVLLSVGGDHGLGLGSVHGMMSHHPDLIVVWVDAHGDINTPETSSTGNFHGMPLSFLLGIGEKKKEFSWMKHKLSPKSLILLGARSLDEAEKKIIEENHIELLPHPSRESLEAMLDKIDPQRTRPIHLSLDIDFFNPDDVRATGCLVSGGPRKEDVFEIGQFLGQTGQLVSVDIVELNPELGSVTDVKNTFSVATDFLKACLF